MNDKGKPLKNNGGACSNISKANIILLNSKSSINYS